MDPLSIITQAPPPAPALLAYSEQLQAIGGVPPYTWTLDLGSLPTGVALSVGGVLSAAASAIPFTAVGTHTFRLKVTDSDGPPNEDTYDYSMEIAASGFDRVKEFQVDSDFRELIGQVLLPQINRELMEKHLFRGQLGVLGDTFAHMVRDVLAENWGGGGDISLKTLLESIEASIAQCVKTINTISPTAAPGQDFTFQAGDGIQISNLINGLMIAATGGGVDLLENSGAVAPGGTLDIDVITSSHLAQLWVESENIYHQAGNIPDHIGPKLGQGIVAGSSGILSMALGDDAGTPVLHVLWQDATPNVNLSRFDAVSMAHIQTLALGAGPTSGLWVGSGPAGEVFVAFVLGGVLWYGEYTSSYAPVVALAATAYVPPSMGVGVVDFVNGAVYISGTQAGGGVSIFEFTIGVGATANWMNAGLLNATLLDLHFDPTTFSGALFFAVSQVLGAPPGPGDLDVWMVAVPFVSPGQPATGVQTIDNTPVNSSNFAKAAIATGPGGVGNRELNIYYIDGTNLTTVPPIGQPAIFRYLKTARLYNLPTFPAATLDGPHSWHAESIIDDAVNSVFIKRWQATDQSDVVFLEVIPDADGVGSIVKRWVADRDGYTAEGDIIYTNPISPIGWIRVAQAFGPGVLSSSALRVFMDDDTYMAVEPIFDEDRIYIQFNPSTMKVRGVNDSPFEWLMKLEVLQESGYIVPLNLLVSCWQIADGLQRYFNAATYFPSPSSNPPGPGGANLVTLTEAELAALSVIGFKFEDYYTVTPGEYDLDGGKIAAAYYYSKDVAGSASDQVVVLRYNANLTEIIVAEAAIKVDIDAYIGGTGPLPVPTNGYYTLATLDALLGTTHSTTYAGTPYSLYQYWCFVNGDGTQYFHAYFSRNYVENAQAYGPAPSGHSNIPVEEVFSAAAGAPGVPEDFTLAQSVLDAEVLVNGVHYLQGVGLDWVFNGMNTISYLNTAGRYVLNAGDEVVVKKYLP